MVVALSLLVYAGIAVHRQNLEDPRVLWSQLKYVEQDERIREILPARYIRCRKTIPRHAMMWRMGWDFMGTEDRLLCVIDILEASSCKGNYFPLLYEQYRGRDQKHMFVRKKRFRLFWHQYLAMFRYGTIEELRHLGFKPRLLKNTCIPNVDMMAYFAVFLGANTRDFRVARNVYFAIKDTLPPSSFVLVLMIMSSILLRNFKVMDFAVSQLEMTHDLRAFFADVHLFIGIPIPSIFLP